MKWSVSCWIRCRSGSNAVRGNEVTWLGATLYRRRLFHPLNGTEHWSPPSLTTRDWELVSILEVRIEPGDLNPRPLTQQYVTLPTIPRAGRLFIFIFIYLFVYILTHLLTYLFNLHIFCDNITKNLIIPYYWLQDPWCYEFNSMLFWFYYMSIIFHASNIWGKITISFCSFIPMVPMVPMAPMVLMVPVVPMVPAAPMVQIMLQWF